MPTIEARRVLPRGAWRDASVYASLPDYGPRGLAWELLRRNLNYPGRALADDGSLIAADDAFVARWGLHFRGGSHPIRV